jgi:hypothetical protein
MLPQSVLTAVDLDCEPSPEADEIQDVTTDRRLSSNVETTFAQGPEANPQPHLLKASSLSEGGGHSR